MYRRLGGTGTGGKAQDCIFFYGKGTENHQFRTGCFFHHRIAAKRGEFISDKMSHIVLSGRWCNIIV